MGICCEAQLSLAGRDERTKWRVSGFFFRGIRSGEKRPSGYKSYCANCGQKNYQLAADGNCTCGVCGRPTRVNFSQTHIQVVTYPGRGTDDGEDFEDWSMHALRERVKLVQELDQLADRMVELALRLTREAQVIEEEYFIPQTRKVLVTTP